MELPAGSYEVIQINCGRDRMRIPDAVARFDLAPGEVIYVGDLLATTLIERNNSLVPVNRKRRGKFFLDIIDKEDVVRRKLRKVSPSLADAMLKRLIVVGEPG
ncbi:MAG: hypothetical protein AAF409_19060 [Pseudomonadota bacterium]